MSSLQIIDHHIKNLLSIPPVLNRLRSFEMLKQLPYVETEELAEFLTVEITSTFLHDHRLCYI